MASKVYSMTPKEIVAEFNRTGRGEKVSRHSTEKQIQKTPANRRDAGGDTS